MPDRKIDMSIVRNFISADPISSIWATCPNKMLWEAIRAEDATICSREEVLLAVGQVSEVYVLPEPLPSLYQSETPAYALVPSATFLTGASGYFETEPLYLISNDFSWMIAMTTENTPSGDQLCALVKNLDTR